MDFFNAAMSAAKLGTPGVQAVVGCQMNHEKNYAFVEFRSFEDATAAMAFDGLISSNHSFLLSIPVILIILILPIIILIILAFLSHPYKLNRDCTTEQHIKSAET